MNGGSSSADENATGRTLAITSETSCREAALVTILLAAVSSVVLGANIFRGEVVAPTYLLADYPGWHELKMESVPGSPHRSDIVDALIPRWRFLKRHLREGSLPLWNPLPNGGEPCWPLVFNSYLTPRFLVFLLLDDPLGFHLGLALQLVIAGLGAFLLARLWVAAGPALLAAVTFMLCGFNVSWLMWQHAATAAWVPWLAWSVVRLLDRPSRRSWVVLVLVTTCLLLGGFPAVAAYGASLAAGLAVVWAAARWVGKAVPGRWRLICRRWALVILGCGAGCLVAAVQLVPSLEFLGHFDLSHRGPVGYSVQPLALLLAPFSEEGSLHPETTGYVGIVALALGLLAAVPMRSEGDRRVRVAAVFWTASLVVSLVLVLRFPRPLADLLYRLPVLRFNPNNRVLVIFGLAAAVLSAIGLQRGVKLLGRCLGGRASVVALGLLIALQTGDLARVCRALNAVVPADSWYPETSVTTWLRDHLPADQAVIAEGFMVAGTLSGYGVREWFAHGFLSETEKAAMDRMVPGSWVTRYAAFPSLARADLEAVGEFDLHAVRYFVVPCATVRTAAAAETIGQPRATDALRLADSGRLAQPISVDRAVVLDGVAVLMTGADHNREGERIKLSLRSVTGHTVAEAVVATRDVWGVSWIEFTFTGRVTLTAGDWFIVLEPLGLQPGTGPMVWQRRTSATGGELAWLFLQPLRLAPHLAADWRVADTAGGICVLENRDTPRGAVLVDGAATTSDTAELLALESGSATYRVRAARSCRLVRSTRSYPGWHVLVNGKRADVEPFRDSLQSVALEEGESTVEWRYQPRSLTLGLLLSVLGAILLVAVCCL